MYTTISYIKIIEAISHSRWPQLSFNKRNSLNEIKTHAYPLQGEKGLCVIGATDSNSTGILYQTFLTSISQCSIIINNSTLNLFSKNFSLLQEDGISSTNLATRFFEFTIRSNARRIISLSNISSWNLVEGKRTIGRERLRVTKKIRTLVKTEYVALWTRKTY